RAAMREHELHERDLGHQRNGVEGCDLLIRQLQADDAEAAPFGFGQKLSIERFPAVRGHFAQTQQHRPGLQSKQDLVGGRSAPNARRMPSMAEESKKSVSRRPSSNCAASKSAATSPSPR